MENNRLQIRLDKIKEYVSEVEANQILTSDELKDKAPDLCNFIIELGYSEFYSRPGLDNKQCQLGTISSLVTQ